MEGLLIMMESEAVNQVEKVATSKLMLGMYIVAFSKMLPEPQPLGLLNSVSVLTKIKKSQVKYALIDWYRSSYQRPHRALTVATSKSISDGIRQQAIACASSKQVLITAKKLMQHLLIDKPEPISLTPITHLAQQIVAQVHHNNDSYRCLDVLRKNRSDLLEHSINVSFLLAKFGQHLKMETDVLLQLAIGGLLHDIGKLKVDNDILNKQTKLSKIEFELIKLHQQYVQHFLPSEGDISAICHDICLQHHEKLDGNGYPHRLLAKQISVYGRMAAIVDIYDALTGNRCYRRALSPLEAFKVLKSMTPNKLDYYLVEQFIECVGFYPVGSLVQLSDERVGVIWYRARERQTSTIVKCFFDMTSQQLTPINYVDLILQPSLTISADVAPHKVTHPPESLFTS